MNTNTAIKLALPAAPRTRAPEVMAEYPAFLRDALDAEHTADLDQDRAFQKWWICPAFSLTRRAELWAQKLAADDRYADTRAAVNTLYEHWQRLCYWSRQECECDDPERTCKPCRARARLADPEYIPTVSTLLHEEF